MLPWRLVKRILEREMRGQPSMRGSCFGTPLAEELRVSAPIRCRAMLDESEPDTTFRCFRELGHDGAHSSGSCSWMDRR